MINIQRLPEPDILKKNKAKWMKAFLEKRAKGDIKRPSHSQYAHQQIRDTLGAMSFHKCFYCECKVGVGKDGNPEVDHHIEVSEEPKSAFKWSNLYLSCQGCNRGKLDNSQIPVSECLDPCDLTENPADHLTFDDEFIRSKACSSKGMKTIQKYKLDRDELDHLRVRQLRDFERFLRQLYERGGKGALTLKEKEAINSFKQTEHAFSLMFSIYLNKFGF